MKTCLKKCNLFITVMFIGMLLIPGVAFAATDMEPFLDFTSMAYYCDSTGGGGNANWCKGGGGYDDYELAFTWSDGIDIFEGLFIQGGNYINGDEFSRSPVTASDVLLVNNAYILIGNLYNSDYPDNLTFGGTSGGTGSVSFDITDGSTTYFTATLDSFTLVEGASGVYSWNMSSDADNVTAISFYDNGSKYIQELEQRYNDGYALNFGFTMSMVDQYGNACDNFLEDCQSSSVAGKFVTTPEPVSSVLFLIGGATLAFRRYRRGIKNKLMKL